MRIKEGYILREIFGEYLVLPYGLRAKEDTRIITLTETGAILWKAMEKDLGVDELVKILLSEFPDIPEKTIESDVIIFVEKLKNGNYISNEE